MAQSNLDFFNDHFQKCENHDTWTDHVSYRYVRILKKFNSEPFGNIFLNTIKDWIEPIIKEDENKLIEKEYNYNLNKRFLLRFYLPIDAMTVKKNVNDKSPQIKNIIIMVNGLDEFGDRFLKQYDHLGAFFAEQNIASVLLSTPFHLHRSVKEIETITTLNPDSTPSNDVKISERIVKPSKYIMENSSNIFLHYQQTINDLEKLVHKIKGRNYLNNQGDMNDSPYSSDADELFYSNLFNDETKVSLLGYSLGGLTSLGAFLTKNELYDNLILFNAPGDLSKAQPRQININKETWAKRCYELQSSLLQTKLRKQANLLGFEASVENFIRLYAGKIHPSSEMNDIIKARKLDIMQIISGNDKVVDKEPWDKYFTEPNGELTNVIISQYIFPNVGHNLMEESSGSELMPKLAQLITDQILTGGLTHFQEKDIKDDLKDILSLTDKYKEYKLNSENAEKNNSDLTIEEFEEKHFNALINDIIQKHRELKKTDGTPKFTEEDIYTKVKTFQKLYILSKYYNPQFNSFLYEILKNK